MSDNNSDKIQEQVEEKHIEELSESKMLENVLQTRFELLYETTKDIIDDDLNKNNVRGACFINEAEMAYAHGNFKEAEQYLQQAETIFYAENKSNYNHDVTDNVNETANDETENIFSFKHPYNYTGYDIINDREDAEKCIYIAQQAMAIGNMIRAQKFFRKAQRMYPTRKGSELLKVLYKIQNGMPQEVIRRIREATDDYELLGVTRDCTYVEVRKAFRRVTVALHPDVNQEPGAKEAYLNAIAAAWRMKELMNPATLHPGAASSSVAN